MNRYLLSGCFAAAAHGALLFGFTKTPRPPRAAVPDEHVIACDLRQPEEEPVRIEDMVRAPANSQSAPPAPRPVRGDEPPVIDVGEKQTIPLPAIQSIASTDMKTVPLPAVGVGTGEGTSPWDTDVVSGKLLDKPPHARFQASPHYPQAARFAGMTGEVHVEFVVDEQGRVNAPRVIRTSDAIFDEPTLRAVAQWRFEPGRKNGRVVKFRMTVPVMFRLNE
jgi:protein TonB